MDDVEDNSTLRRGIPVAHKIYGIPQTINCANYVYFQVFQEIGELESRVGESSSFRNSEDTSTSTSTSTSGNSASHSTSEGSNFGGKKRTSLSNLVTSELLNLHRGQGMDLLWRDSLNCPTEEEYVEMVNNKTGGLFRIALGLMCRFSGSYRKETKGKEGKGKEKEETEGKEQEREGKGEAKALNLIPLANLIGLLFQIRDDYMNLEDKDYETNKGFAEDLTEGKFSFPIIHGIRSSEMSNPNSSTSISSSIKNPNLNSNFRKSSPTNFPTSSSSSNRNRQLLNILSQRPTDLSLKIYAVKYMKEITGSFDYTREVLRRLDRLAREEVERIGKEVEKRWGEEGKGSNKGLIMILDGLRKGWWKEGWE